MLTISDAPGRLRPAAGVIPVGALDDPATRVYLVQRGGEALFLPGFHGFPGGACEPGDAEVPVAHPPDDPLLAACAARELFEEVGVLLAAEPPPPGSRCRLLSGEVSFAELGLPVDGRLLLPAGIRTTPPYSPLRFRARFYVAAIPTGQQPSPFRPELAGGDWWEPAEALEAWERGEIALAPPTREALQALRGRTAREAARLLEEQPDREEPPFTLTPGLHYLPLRVDTLPPHDHTLCQLVGGERMLLVDPAADRPELEAALERFPVVEALLTHHHPDHIGGARRVRARGIPLAAHPETAARLPFPVDRRVVEGDRWELGRDAAGQPWLLEALHTPGHAPGHLALWEPHRRILLAGDMVAGVGSILVDPVEGDMAEYLRSLERLRRLRPRLVIPSHGAPAGPGSDLPGHFLAHRRMRERRLLEALEEGPLPLDALASRAYEDRPGTPPELARRSLLAHLIQLEREGRVRRIGEGWAAGR